MYIPLEIGSVRDQSLAEARRVIEAGACAGAMAMAATMAPTQAHPIHSTLLQTPLLAPAGEQRGLEFGHRRSGVTRGAGTLLRAQCRLWGRANREARPKATLLRHRARSDEEGVVHGWWTTPVVLRSYPRKRTTSAKRAPR